MWLRPWTAVLLRHLWASTAHSNALCRSRLLRVSPPAAPLSVARSNCATPAWLGMAMQSRAGRWSASIQKRVAIILRVRGGAEVGGARSVLELILHFLRLRWVPVHRRYLKPAQMAKKRAETSQRRWRWLLCRMSEVPMNSW